MRPDDKASTSFGLFPTGLALILLGGCAHLEPMLPSGENDSEEIPRHLSGPLATDPIAEPVFHPRPYIDWTEHATHIEAPDPDAPPEDIWERIRRGLAMEDRDNQRIDQHIDWYTRHPAYLDRVATRAEPYLYYILEEIEAREMPTEMALLPVIESAYDPFAYSHGRASGIWQFIPSTGRHFGLEQNWWYDGRRDIVESTEAALDYLQQLADRFDGDWELALAAYNAGGGTISRAQRQNRNQGRETDYWSLNTIPRETQGYVPKLLALRAVIKDPDAYELSLRPLENEPYLARVELDGQIDLAVAADLADIDLDELYHLNPGFNRWATNPDGPHRLLIPRDSEEDFKDGLAELDESEQVQWRRHQISQGESLETIARKYNVTVNLLREINEIQGDTIRAGTHLLVPEASSNLADYSKSEEQRLAQIRSTPRGNRDRIDHNVSSGESLWNIARQYGVRVSDLAEWNGMAPGDTLRSGQELTVWVEEGSQAGMAARMSGGPNTPDREITYRVRSGDSLSTIASRFGVSVSDLVRWNNISTDQPLQPGQRIRVIVDITATSGG